MALKTIDENPSITDTVVFDILTPDSDGCFTDDPYKVEKVIIYYVERDFSQSNPIQYDIKHLNPEDAAAAQVAALEACNDPTAENIAAAKLLQDKADSSSSTTAVYYNDAKPVKIIGSSDYPAWLSTDTDNALIVNIPEDESGNPQFGHFQYEWSPVGMREGDYFICWTWMPLSAGDSLSAHLPFSLIGDTLVTTSIPTHVTDPNKYVTLLDNYLPEMFKTTIADDDLTPDVLDKFNKAVASGFTFLEDLTNQIVDLQDANSTHEALLPLLGNYFDLRLKTNDPTLWRRQIKRAIPLYKRKGTKRALEEALDQAGIRLIKLTKLWQVVSKYTYQESFLFDDTTSFILSKVALPYDADNFELAIRYSGSSTYDVVSYTNATFETVDGVTTMTISDDLSLESGDIVRILYNIVAVPNPTQQNIEDYVRSLPLSDQRDEADQLYPLKNWNVRVIEEDDTLFDSIVTVRHPFQENVIFGKVRTQFPYSENVYNKEEYNGSLRDSENPCDIDKSFVDSCGMCQGSKFSIDLEIENLSNDSLLEAQEVIKEFVPFHAVLHSINFSGSVNEFVQPPIENIEKLVYVAGGEFVIAGSAQLEFGRAMFFGLTSYPVLRDSLADTETEVSGATGTAYNDTVVIFCPEVRFDNIGLDISTESTVLEIMSPHTHAGTYQLVNPSGNFAVPVGISEPITTSAFTFRVSNIGYTNSSASITQDDNGQLSDSNVAFDELGIVSQWDIDHQGESDVWHVFVSGTYYPILNVLPNNIILFATDESLTSSSGLTYTITDNSYVVKASSTTGDLTVINRGLLEITDVGLDDIRNVCKLDDYIFYDDTSTQYEISSFVTDETHSLYIANWTGGNVAGKTIYVYDRLKDNQTGYVDYSGLKLDTLVDQEDALQIQNGQNPPVTPLENNRFKENFLVAIQNGMDTDYYVIADIDGTTITLVGPKQTWTTLSEGGTSVTYTIYRYVKQPVTIVGRESNTYFDTIDRRGKEIITSETESAVSMAMTSSGDAVADAVSQGDSVRFVIEYADGSKEKGEI